MNSLASAMQQRGSPTQNNSNNNSPRTGMASDPDDYTNTSGAGTSPTSGTNSSAMVGEGENGLILGHGSSEYEVLVENGPEAESSEEQVMQYAQFLGFDMEEDQDLLWIAREGLKEPFPKEWKILRHVETQQIMYMNDETGETSVEDPRDVKYKTLFTQEKDRKAELQQRKLVTSASTSYQSRQDLPSSPSKGEEEDRIKSSVTALDSSVLLLNSSGSFRRQHPPSVSGESAASPSSPAGSKTTISSNLAQSSSADDQSSRSDPLNNIQSNHTSWFPPQSTIGTQSTSFLQRRNTSQRSSLSEDDVETMDDESALLSRRAQDVGTLSESLSLRKQGSTESMLLGTHSNGAGGERSRTDVQHGGIPPSSSSSAENRKETRESRHRETIRRIEAEITILREDIVETRKYADAAAVRAQEAHAERRKAEARAQLAEDEQVRLKNELETVLADGERRRQTLTKELDETIKRLLSAEDARDAAERRSREILMEESSRVKHMEREMEGLRSKLAKALRENESLLAFASASSSSLAGEVKEPAAASSFSSSRHHHRLASSQSQNASHRQQPVGSQNGVRGGEGTRERTYPSVASLLESIHAAEGRGASRQSPMIGERRRRSNSGGAIPASSFVGSSLPSGRVVGTSRRDW